MWAPPLKVVDVAGTPRGPAADRPALAYFVAGSAAVDAASRPARSTPTQNLGLATSAGAAPASQSTDPKTVPLETFSAGGPVQIGSTTQCRRGAVGPCQGVAGSRFRTAVAPTWTAADGVSVSGSGGFPNPNVCPAATNGPVLRHLAVRRRRPGSRRWSGRSSAAGCRRAAEPGAGQLAVDRGAPVGTTSGAPGSCGCRWSRRGREHRRASGPRRSRATPEERSDRGGEQAGTGADRRASRCRGGTHAGVSRPGLVPVPGGHQAGHRHHREDADDEREREQRRDGRHRRPDRVRPVQHQLVTDQAEDRGGRNPGTPAVDSAPASRK